MKIIDNFMPVVQPIRMPTKGRNFFFKVWQAFVPRKWMLINDFIYRSKKYNLVFMVPAPFKFDFASVPRIFWWFLDPVGLLLIGSIFHDFAYRYGGILVRQNNESKWSFVELSRFESDDLFKEITEEVNGMFIMAHIAKYAVNIGGWIPYIKARKENKKVFLDYPFVYSVKSTIKSLKTKGEK